MSTKALRNRGLRSLTGEASPVQLVHVRQQYRAQPCHSCSEVEAGPSRLPARRSFSTVTAVSQSNNASLEVKKASRNLPEKRTSPLRYRPHVRYYATEATSQSSSTAVPVHETSTIEGSITSHSSFTPAQQAGTSLNGLAINLQSLLIDSTGRHPGKQRQVAWPDSEGGAEEEQEWLKRLQWAANQRPVLGAERRKTVVTVLGSSSEDIASFSQALLSDPLASDQGPAQRLAERAASARSIRNKEQIRTITHSDVQASASTTDDATTSVSVASRYLQDNHLELREVLFDPTRTTISSTLWTALLTSDIVIVQDEPQSASDLYKLLQKRNVIFTKNSAVDATTPGSQRIFAPVTSTPSSSGKQSMVVDIDQALQANKILLQAGTNGLSAFSALSLRSGIPQLSEHITNLAASTSTQAETLHSLLSRAVLDMASNLASSHQILYEAAGRVGRLALQTARDKKHSEIELGFTDLDKLDLEQLVADSITRSKAVIVHGNSTVVDAKAPRVQQVTADEATAGVEEVVLLEDGTKGVEMALASKRLIWWKLPLGRADDVATELALGLSTYFAGLERKLIFETGRLAERSLDLSLQVNNLLKSPPFSQSQSPSNLSYYSATLNNEIATLSPTTQFGFPPPAHPSSYNLSQTSLSSPIVTRRLQLKAQGGAIERMQLRAQKAVVGFYSLSGLSATLAVFLNQTSWMQFQQDVPFCVGLAGLGIAAAAWRLQGNWKKAKSKFWIDWKRAQDGLAADLQTNADEALDSKVFIKADTACKLLRKGLNARKASLQDIESRLRHIQSGLKQA